MRRMLCLCAAALTLLSACDLIQVETGSPVTPEPAPVASVTSAPWVMTTKQRYNELFGLAWYESDVTHPINNTNRFNHDVYTLVYESLFNLNEIFEPEPALCTAIESDGDTRFTLTLQNGVTFHDGEPLACADVVYSFQAARAAVSPYSSSLRDIVSVRETGELTLEVTLSEPNPRFAALLTFPVVKRESLKETFPWPGTGPYRFGTLEVGDESESEEVIVKRDAFLEIYTAWWRHSPLPLGRIELCPISGPDELPYLVGVGDVSAVVDDPGDSFGVGFKGDFVRWDYPTAILHYVGVNSGHPLLGDSRMRRALSLGFDRRELADKFYGGAAEPSLLPIPPESPLYGASADREGYDLQLMSALLDEMGLSDEDEDGYLDYAGDSLTLRILVEEDSRQSAAAFLCESLQSVGINAVVTALPHTSFVQALQAGEYELYYSHTKVPADFNLGDWQYRESLLTGAVRTPALSTGTSLNGEWLEQMPAIPLLFRRQSLLTQRSAADGVKPVYLRPFANISDWKVFK